MNTQWLNPVITHEYISRYGQPHRWMYCLRYFRGGAIFNGYDTKEEAQKYIRDCRQTGKWVYYGRESTMIRIVSSW
jgi:hypothetical protein